MINCLAIRCSLAFAPYILESTSEFAAGGNIGGRLVKHGGFGMTFHADGGLVLHHQNRESRLTRADAVHYEATIDFRRQCFDVVRLSDEVVFASIGNTLFVSHPQSELWLERSAVSLLVRAAAGESDSSLIDGVTYSVGAGRLMLSDQRNGRWVLLGNEHVSEMERRFAELQGSEPVAKPAMRPPTFSLKGVAIHLQSGFKLIETLKQFSTTGEFVPFSEQVPAYSLHVGRCSEGLEIRDSSNRAAITKREAPKWADIITTDLDSRNAKQFERDGIRTVIASDGQGKWALQWGDEVFLPTGWATDTHTADMLEGRDEASANSLARLRFANNENRTVIIDISSGSCVGLSSEEAEAAKSQR